MPGRTRPPAIRYARSADTSIAYSLLGRGPAIVESPHVQMSHLQVEWEMEAVQHWCKRLSQHHTLLRFDHRGCGLSRGQNTDFSLDAIARDIETVVTSAGLDRFALFGRITGGLPAIAYAAKHPGKVTHLVLWNSFASHQAHGANPRMRTLFDMASADWELFTESISQAALGWRDAGVARQWAHLLREASSQADFLRYLAARPAWDVSELLPGMSAKTLVIFDQANRLADAERSRELAAQIPHAQFITTSGWQGMPDDDAIDAIERFLDDGATPSEPRPANLTRRETQVLALVATGATNADIARQLSISINTVTRHLTHIFAKLKVTNRAQAIRFAMERNIGA